MKHIRSFGTHLGIDFARVQNIVGAAADNLSANPEKLTEKEVSEFVFSDLTHPNPHEAWATLSLPSLRRANGAEAGWPWGKL